MKTLLKFKIKTGESTASWNRMVKDLWMVEVKSPLWDEPKTFTAKDDAAHTAHDEALDRDDAYDIVWGDTRIIRLQELLSEATILVEKLSQES